MCYINKLALPYHTYLITQDSNIAYKYNGITMDRFITHCKVLHQKMKRKHAGMLLTLDSR